MVIHFEASTHALISYQEQKLKHSPVFFAFRFIYSILVTVIVGLLLFLYEQTLTVILVSSAIVFFITTLVFCATPLFSFLLSWISKKITPNTAFPVELKLDDNGLSATLASGTTRAQWHEFKQIYHDDTFYFLTTKKEVFTLPIACPIRFKQLIGKQLEQHNRRCKNSSYFINL
ncbi:YcxB family protein [Brochothrix campestris]|uniref:YcxB family protein n=1 Tax=Brochothrix campestris TaxID=2757 RepID=UPI0038CFAD98